MWTFLAGIGAAAFAWWLFNLALPEAADLVPEEVTSRGREGDLLEVLAAHIAAPVQTGNHVRILENGNEIFPPMLRAIDAAEDTVNFLTYVYWTGEIADDFSESLARASERGVEVRVLLDAFGAKKMRPEIVERMREARCQIAWFHPFSWYHLRHYNNRTHRKILVVDGRHAFTGGVGIAEEWNGDGRSEGSWRDDHFEVHGPVVAQLQGAFGENWSSTTGEVIAGEGFFPELEEAGTARAVPMVTSPRGDRSIVAFTYWLLLQAAERQVEIATPYFVPDASLVETIRETAERGVAVRLLVPGDTNDSRMARWASRSLYQPLLESGVEIFEYQPSMMHTKLLLVDGRYSLIGSANFDNRSFELNDEISLVLDDESLTARLIEGFDGDLEFSEPIEAKGFESPIWWQRFLGGVSLVVREQL